MKKDGWSENRKVDISEFLKYMKLNNIYVSEAAKRFMEQFYGLKIKYFIRRNEKLYEDTITFDIIPECYKDIRAFEIELKQELTPIGYKLDVVYLMNSNGRIYSCYLWGICDLGNNIYDILNDVVQYESKDIDDIDEYGGNDVGEYIKLLNYEEKMSLFAMIIHPNSTYLASKKVGRLLGIDIRKEDIENIKNNECIKGIQKIHYVEKENQAIFIDCNNYDHRDRIFIKCLSISDSRIRKEIFSWSILGRDLDYDKHNEYFLGFCDRPYEGIVDKSESLKAQFINIDEKDRSDKYEELIEFIYEQTLPEKIIDWINDREYVDKYIEIHGEMGHPLYWSLKTNNLL